ncbi:MAG: zinc-binding dehydrogenase [Gammaproteobacteria bacterium]
MSHAANGLQLRTLVRAPATEGESGQLELWLEDVATPTPKPDEVLVRVEASPINPSDLGLLFGGADMTTARASGTSERPKITADVPSAAMRAMAARLNQSLPAGNEGAGIVVAAGESPAAQALLGKTVAILGGAMYAHYRAIRAAQCLVLPEGTTPAEGASCFVNPLTALGMVETMRLEGHKALVHTAAASNLGQMLVKICQKDSVPLVNIVRRQDHVDLLKRLGAEYVCNSSDPDFMGQLTDALVATGATVAFDATGGGRLASQILTCMEAALNRTSTEFNRYGSSTHKQVYIYGGLDRSTTELTRSFGMAWGLGGWLLTPFLQKIGPAAAQQLRERVAAEIKTTFASHYTRVVSLPEMLTLGAIGVYGAQATGQKYLVAPRG